MRPASEPSFSPTSCNLRNEWRQPSKLDHLPVLGDGGLTQGTEGAAPTPRLVASHRRLVLPVTEGLLLRCHAQQHHLNDGATLLAFKVHFHHQGANGSHANNGARYTYQFPHEIGLDVLEGHERLKVEDSHTQARVHNSVCCRDNHGSGGKAADRILRVVEQSGAQIRKGTRFHQILELK